ncbi:hypothetical protein [Catalinimonas niigatensis]|uniref:hypothetical protein n=1 Tax=Catalinimonas niigatensis TaxID=1397264 RepID=UPI0026671801|nr:hypothetical protein [Catalinimonas niigatensis]WPP51541.1 hypothetical protein PZB72_03965 [Catalinimonas niigatensis]
MKNKSTTSFLHYFHFFSIAVVLTLLFIFLQHGELLAQSKKDKLPTIKVSRKKKEALEVKEIKKSKTIQDSYSGPKTTPTTGRPKDSYKRLETLRKPEKSKDQYRQPASKTVNYDNSPQQNRNTLPPLEEGQDKSKGSFWKRMFKKKTVSTFEGNLKTTKQEEGTKGTDYQGNIKQQKIDYNQLAKDQHLYQGKIRKAPQKRLDRQFQYKAEYMNFYSGGKRVPTPHKKEKQDKVKSDDLQSAGMYRVKKPNDKAAAYTTYHDQIKLPTSKAKTRNYKKLSDKVHQYDGDVRYRKPGKDMHPSVFYLKAKTKNSYEQKEKYRRWRLVISHIFKQSDQPKRVKEKDRKPRYDKDESEIWYY